MCLSRCLTVGRVWFLQWFGCVLSALGPKYNRPNQKVSAVHKDVKLHKLERNLFGPHVLAVSMFNRFYFELGLFSIHRPYVKTLIFRLIWKFTGFNFCELQCSLVVPNHWCPILVFGLLEVSSVVCECDLSCDLAKIKTDQNREKRWTRMMVNVVTAGNACPPCIYI